MMTLSFFLEINESSQSWQTVANTVFPLIVASGAQTNFWGGASNFSKYFGEKRQNSVWNQELMFIFISQVKIKLRSSEEN